MADGQSKTLMQGMFLNKRKRAAIAVDMGDDRVRIYAKGGPDFLLPYCTSLMLDSDNVVSLEETITEDQWENFKEYSGGKEYQEISYASFLND
jgi:magnesium-transporting ATPase (P-type)